MAAPSDSPAAPAPAHHAMAQTLALLQPWIDFVPQQQRRLGLFVCFALAVHVAAFFFVRIDATRAELQHPARIHVTIEGVHPSGQAEGSGAFLDSLSDPRLFLLPVVPLNHFVAEDAASGLSEINPPLGTRELPAPAAAENYPLLPDATPSLQQQVTAGMQPERQPFVYDEPAPPVMTKTAWQWDPDLGPRHPAGAPQLPSPVSDTDLNPTELRVAIDPDGGVEHVLLDETCQKPELDQLAILAARKLRFPRVDQPGEVWAHLTVFWHCTAPPQEVVVPTPLAPSGP